MIVDRSALAFFEALASTTRLAMLECLGNGDMNVHELAQQLNISSTIAARHVKQLESVGLIRCQSVPGRHGVQKKCHLVHSGILLSFMRRHVYPTIMNFEIPVGSYTNWSVRPPCGMEFEKNLPVLPHSYMDDERFFADPHRHEAGIIWLTHGFLEYVAPNYVLPDQRLMEIRIQLELCSEAPGYAMNWPSDIHFWLNGVHLGFWTAPGDFGDRGGTCSPDHPSGFTSKYGELVQIVVNHEGTFIGVKRTGNATIKTILSMNPKSFCFRIESPEDAENPRGFNIFGKGFGDYGQHILFSTVAVEGTS